MMNIADLASKIEMYFESEQNDIEKVLRDVYCIIDLLNKGKIRVLNVRDYSINSWIRKAILLLFRYSESSPGDFDSYDKIGLLKYDTGNKKYRKVPGAFIRDGVYIGNGCVIMPSYINIGAYIDDNTMIDINASIGSCAQIGKNCHISAGCCIGGVLEPIVASPVIIEDDCFIGGNSAILEGVVVRKGAVVASGTTVSASTKIIDRNTGEILPFGVIPEMAVAVQGSYPSSGGVNINCVVIVKYLGEANKKVSINNILREM
ncbi:MAG: 2,3,4,5-tetrahydropyridine-2,6-dicarboxylate N-succinyltransferase [Holosporales bacterium]|jgi:2,3,4,5-tetrahydropyridine-2-carboxylate N-succinyltransferase|nr:2,3,4,5-tetrahydropyridine-2,6-dicarboxylate N-succinyltransferase [Holosporales bacterium]